MLQNALRPKPLVLGASRRLLSSTAASATRVVAAKAADTSREAEVRFGDGSGNDMTQKNLDSGTVRRIFRAELI